MSSHVNSAFEVIYDLNRPLSAPRRRDTLPAELRDLDLYEPREKLGARAQRFFAHVLALLERKPLTGKLVARPSGS